MTELDRWVPRTKACQIIGDALGEGQPISVYRLMRLVRAGRLVGMTIGAGAKPRYYISTASIQQLLSAG